MAEETSNGKDCPGGRPCVMPEVTFTTFIMSLNTSALYHLGEIKDPATGQTGTDLVLAKHAIDTLQLIKEKTKGNLLDKEQELLDNMLTDLKLRYVRARG
ncbi:MAG: DUF1844 domain-containing protein [Thermodesulfobacteriota bacterium]